MKHKIFNHDLDGGVNRAVREVRRARHSRQEATDARALYWRRPRRPVLRPADETAGSGQ
ncbi:protein of unknown function [Cupriavidus taiwanensis]|uniref:Uncharacterized protein n=1 Tax=Cupriavidus taiwanensis TaxID=164546 RepID=A0A375GYJ5_9BURK|nr:hypothetical protein CBM2588_A120352 [Cupriavidus taiwanensis]SOY45889.1 hypothetical protein CBM2592_A160272 [Cupriavidus taiwanensis]SOY81347.1 hypothetical protein CBM2591_A190271 [Cupriavidus taiwanensis]SOZ54374.1 hypothetical protein CBM2617_A170184 [Cupriavidus taiwanensis]SOZ77894.1 hypothetical protein CBM2622_A150350 [Cupriavidus taiwanensis]